MRAGLLCAGAPPTVAAQNRAQNPGQKEAPAPGAFSGGRARAVVRGSDWQIIERNAGGRAFYDVRIFPGERGTYEILPEALRGAVRFAREHNTWVTYTAWIATRRGRVPVALVVGAGGILLRTTGAVSLRRIRRLIEIALKVDSEIAQNAQDEEGEEQEE